MSAQRRDRTTPPLEGSASARPPDAPSAASAGAPASASASASAGATPGLDAYLQGMALLHRSRGADAPRPLSAAEVRRHTTGRMRAVAASSTPSHDPRATTGGSRTVTGGLPSVATTGGLRAVALGHASLGRARMLPVLALALAAVLLLMRPLQPDHSDVPLVARGAWVTRHPDYASRQLVLSARTVVLSVAGTPAAPEYPVRSVTTRANGDTLHLVVVYDERGEAVEFPLRLTGTGSTRRLHLPHPEGVVWEPQTSVSPPAMAAVSASPDPSAQRPR